MSGLRILASILLGCGGLVGLAAAQSTVIVKGPHSWTNACGETLDVTVTIDTAPAEFPGLYKWDYEINNGVMYSDVSYPEFVTCHSRVGPAWFGLTFAQQIQEIANMSASHDVDLAVDSWGAWVSWMGDGLPAPGCVMYTGDPFVGCGGNIPVLQEPTHVSFTTLPRAIMLCDDQPRCFVGAGRPDLICLASVPRRDKTQNAGNFGPWLPLAEIAYCSAASDAGPKLSLSNGRSRLYTQRRNMSLRRRSRSQWNLDTEEQEGCPDGLYGAQVIQLECYARSVRLGQNVPAVATERRLDG